MDDILDELDDEESVTVEDSVAVVVEKVFPTNLQRSMMGKQWNDVFWPLIHLAFGLFIALWIINGLGGIGPLSVDGSGGNIELETAYGIGYEQWQEGEIYPCEPSVQVGECKNSLTPLSGDASSMPAGFYWDGILFMILGMIGMISSLVFHLAIIPGWRARVKAMKEVEDDSTDAQTDSEDDSNVDSEEDTSEEEEDGNVESEDDYDEEFEDDEEGESDEDEDDIDIGSRIGLTLEDEEVFGVIIEFDDEEGTVTIEEDDTGDEITGYQDDMFLE